MKVDLIKAFTDPSILEDDIVISIINPRETKKREVEVVSTGMYSARSGMMYMNH